MNDFTKEELEEIKYLCRENYELATKLKSMIGDYCEHDWIDKPVHCERYGCDTKNSICIKCGTVDI